VSALAHSSIKDTKNVADLAMAGDTPNRLHLEREEYGLAGAIVEALQTNSWLRPKPRQNPTETIRDLSSRKLPYYPVNSGNLTIACECYNRTRIL
jgi:hypothetical protein